MPRKNLPVKFCVLAKNSGSLKTGFTLLTLIIQKYHTIWKIQMKTSFHALLLVVVVIVVAVVFVRNVKDCTLEARPTGVCIRTPLSQRCPCFGRTKKCVQLQLLFSFVSDPIPESTECGRGGGTFRSQTLLYSKCFLCFSVKLCRIEIWMNRSIAVL